jgi:Ribbon-helix-helix protein, copG family
MPFARISITLPKALLTAADRRAKQLDRPRSWVVADALRLWLTPAATGPAPGTSAAAVREAQPPAYGAAEVAEARRRHLDADLKLGPAERLRRAEGLGRLARARQRRGSRAQIIGFDSYEDYYEWKKARRVGV